MRRFELRRDVDETGISGTGFVAEGVMFSDGVVALHWRGDYASTVIWPEISGVYAVHGHNGLTPVVFVD